MTTTPTTTGEASHLIEELLADFAAAHGLTIRLGYVGNLDDRFGDDRYWTAWVYNARDDRSQPWKITLAAGSPEWYRTDDLPAFLAFLEAGTWIAELAAAPAREVLDHETRPGQDPVSLDESAALLASLA